MVKTLIAATAVAIMVVLFMDHVAPLRGYDPAPRYATLVYQ